MRKTLFIAIVMLICFIYPVSASASTKDCKIVNKLCKQYNRPIKLISGHSKKNSYIISHRKGKKYILVERVLSRSTGKDFGYELDGGYHIAYNKKVKKDKLVTSYIIYDFNSNEPDEILYVVDNNRYR